jgi:DNA-binding CsgD family transcriptional regulator
VTTTRSWARGGPPPPPPTTVAEGEVVARDDAGARLVGVHGLDGVVACPLRRRAAVPAAWAAYVSPSNRSALAFADTAPTAAGALPVLLYVFRDRLAATLHALHRCVAWPLVLVCDERGPRFESLCADDWLLRAGLTPREADVLALLAARRTNDEIAATLVVSPTTVRSHCRAVMRKLEVADRRELWAALGRAAARRPPSAGAPRGGVGGGGGGGGGAPPPPRPRTSPKNVVWPLRRASRII